MSTAKTLININLIVAATLLIGVANNMAIAGFFGLTRLIDAYFAAYMLPAVVMSLFVGFLGKNFLPAFSDLKKNGDDLADRMTSSIINIVFIIVTIFTALLWIFADNVFSVILPGFSSTELSETTKMFRIMAPSMVLMAINIFNVYVCQYHEKYAQVMLCKMVLPVALLCSIFLGKNILNEYSLPFGLLLGNMMMFILLSRSADYRYSFIFDYRSMHIRRIFVNSGILMSSGVIARSRPLIEKYFGSMLDAGAISGISMANRLVDPLQSRAATGIRMIAFTKASKLHANDKLKELGVLHNNALISLLMVIVPIVVWIAYNSSEIVSLLFMRGNFNSDMHHLVTMALIGLLPSVIAISAAQIMANAFYAVNKVAVPAILGTSGTLLYLACVGFLSSEYGVLGLALAQSAAFVAMFIAFIILLNKELRWFSSTRIFSKLVFYILVSGLSVWVAAHVSNAVFVGNIYRISTSFVLGAALYVMLLAMTNDYGFNYFKEKFFRKK